MLKQTNPFTIGIDARLSGQRHAGIGRYIENLIIHAIAAHEDNQKINWIIFFHDRQQAAPIQAQLQQENNVKFVYVPIRHYSLREQWQWPLILNEQNLDLLHVPHFNVPLLYQGQMVITIHDLLWHQQIGPEVTTLPAYKYYVKYIAYRLVTNLAVKKAKIIYVPTQSVALTLDKHYPHIKNKVVVTGEGISHIFQQEFQQQHSNPKSALDRKRQQQLIYVGSLYPHKNVKVVLQALQQLPNLSLKIVGARDVFVERTKKLVADLNLQQQVIFSGFLPDQDLVNAIKQSLALIQPSTSEGFGLTGLEAMACGTPVLAADIDVFHEVYQQAPIYFQPHQPQELVAAINKLKDQDQIKSGIQQGYQQVKKYSWKQMSQIVNQHNLKLVTANER